MKNISLFTLIYIVIAIASAHHTSWGAATTMQGIMPSAGIDLVLWWLQGFAFALAIDVSMLAIANLIRNGERSAWYIIAFVFVALLSTYTQLLYGWAHTPIQPPSVGVPTEWVQRLQWLIDARILILPLALPTISVLYTIAGLGGHGANTLPANDAPATQVHTPPVQQHLHLVQLQDNSTPTIAPVKQRPALTKGGTSGGESTGVTQGHITMTNDSLYAAKCPYCDFASVRPTNEGSRKSLVAHLRHKHPVELSTFVTTSTEANT